MTVSSVKEAIIEVLAESERPWLYKSQIARRVFRKYPAIAKNQETIFRQLRRLAEEGVVVRYRYRNRALYALKSRVERVKVHE